MAKESVTNPHPFVFECHKGLNPLEKAQDVVEKARSLAMVTDQWCETSTHSRALLVQNQILQSELLTFASTLLDEAIHALDM